MKLSFMTFACEKWSLEQVIAGAVRHGYHGIEFRTDAQHAHGVEATATPAARREAKARLSDAGISACCIATSLQFATDKSLEEAPARIDLARDLGSPGLRVFCGPLPAGVTGKAAHELVAGRLRKAAERAAAAGVELWLETHDSFSKAADVAATVLLAGHSSVGINYDNMHPYRNGETLDETLKALGDLVRHTHFHDAVGKPEVVLIKPLNHGDLPMDAMFRALGSKGFDGYLSGEWFGTQYGQDSDSSLAAFAYDMRALAERNGRRLG
ncbi:MAG: sugar phosphate isomerase/epimerase [Planctomycetota bacterium]|nr:sugar phosphate isomerase/epimerase [Planctomycetota bacterium]